MIPHKVIDSIGILTLEQLKSLDMTKGEAFANYDGTFDFALPQDWLNDFASHCGNITYDNIISTTVWAYPDGMPCGQPMTCCKEVYLAYKRWTR